MPEWACLSEWTVMTVALPGLMGNDQRSAHVQRRSADGPAAQHGSHGSCSLHPHCTPRPGPWREHACRRAPTNKSSLSSASRATSAAESTAAGSAPAAAAFSRLAVSFFSSRSTFTRSKNLICSTRQDGPAGLACFFLPFRSIFCLGRAHTRGASTHAACGWECCLLKLRCLPAWRYRQQRSCACMQSCSSYVGAKQAAACS